MEATEDGDTSMSVFLADLNGTGKVCSLVELAEVQHENPLVLGSIRAISPMVAQSSLQRQNVIVFHMKEIYHSDDDYVRKKFKIVFVGDAATAVHNSNLRKKDYLLLSRPKLSFDGALKRDREFYKRFFTIGQWPGDEQCKIYFKKKRNVDWIPLDLNPERFETNQGNAAVVPALSDDEEKVIENSAAENPLKRKSTDDVSSNKKKPCTSETAKAPSSPVHENVAMQEPSTEQHIIQNFTSSPNRTSPIGTEDLSYSIIQNATTENIIPEVPSSPLNQNVAIEETSTSGKQNLQHFTTSLNRTSPYETEELSPSVIQNVITEEIVREQPSSSEQLIQNVIVSSTPIERTADENESETLSPLSLNTIDQQTASESSSLNKENTNKSSPTNEKSTDEKISSFKKKSEKSILGENCESTTTENQAIISYETVNQHLTPVNPETITLKNINNLLLQPTEKVVDKVLTKWPKNKSSEEFTIKTHLLITIPAIDENSNEDSIFSFIRGYCNNCSNFYVINDLPWLRENFAEFPLCPHCRKDEKIHKLRCQLVFRLLLQDEDDFSKTVYLMDKHAETFLGYTLIDLYNSPEIRRKAVEFLNSCKFEEGKNNKTLTVKIKPILDKFKKLAYHVIKVQVS